MVRGYAGDVSALRTAFMAAARKRKSPELFPVRHPCSSGGVLWCSAPVRATDGAECWGWGSSSWMRDTSRRRCASTASSSTAFTTRCGSGRGYGGGGDGGGGTGREQDRGAMGKGPRTSRACVLGAARHRGTRGRNAWPALGDPRAHPGPAGLDRRWVRAAMPATFEAIVTVCLKWSMSGVSA